MNDDWSDAPCLTLQEPEDDLARILRTASTILLAHPDVMQSLFRALVAEGRRFAETEDGARWRKALAGSTLLRHGRALWESSALNLLEDADGAVLPSAVVDALVYAMSRPDLHERLAALRPEG